MARFLAIDWDLNQLHVAAANVSGGSVRILGAGVASDCGSFNPGEAGALGARLREVLQEHKISPAPVLAALGRDRVIVKEVRYPAVPAHEEPAVVRFQAVKELSHSADEVVIDYLPVGEASPTGERRAFVLIVRREVIGAYQELCKAAGLKLAAVTPRVFGLVACLERVAGTTVLTPRPEPADAAVAVIAVAESWSEFCVARNGKLLMARTLTAGPALVGEVRRNLAVHAGQNPAFPIRAIYVAGGAENAALREKLRSTLEVPVHLLDPFAGSERPGLPAPERRGGFAPLVGLLQLRAQSRTLPVNLVEPKQPRPPEDPNKRKALLAALLVASLLVAAGALGWLRLSSLEREVRVQAAANGDLDRLKATLEEDARRARAIKEWHDSSIVWLDEVYDLTHRFPDPDTSRVRLSQLTADVVDRGPGAKEKKVARMSLKGVTGDDHKPVDHLVSRLVQDGHYHPDPKKIERNSGPDARLGFTQMFTIQRIDVTKRLPKDYVLKMDEETRAENEGEFRRRATRGR